MKTNGYVIWQGTSLLDGKPIVVIATGFASSSANKKTGAMIQTWILRADVEPHTAIKTGEDESVCGGCVHRGTAHGDRTEGRSCYVLTQQAPLAVYRGWRRGIYGTVQLGYELLKDVGKNRRLRLGSYGDPAAVPAWVWHAFVARASGWTGYTHQWATMSPAGAKAFQPLCMASCDSALEQKHAKKLGWRCFTVLPKSVPLTHDVALARFAGLVICPASEERGHRTTCAKCGLCQGTTTKTPMDIVIGAHGAGASLIAKRS